MKKVLIIGASILQLPAIKKAKELGFYVGVIDFNPNAIGIPYADEYFNVSTIDIEGVVAAAKAFSPDGIMTLATDMPMRSIAAACNALGLPGISMETAIKSTDKGEMIKAFSECGVEHPWFFIAKDKEEFEKIKPSISFPCIMKPTDNSGSRGVVLAHSIEELEAFYSYTEDSSRSGAVIIEEFMTGSEVSVEVVVLDGEPHVLAITDKVTTGAPHFVEMGHSQQSALPEEDKEKIKDLACRATKAVGITCGPAHVEIMNTAGGPKMVELGARMGGDCITTHLVPLSTGVDMVEATLRLAVGEVPDIKPKFDKGSAIRYFSVPAGTITSIDGVKDAEKIPGVKEISFVKNVGDKVGEIGSSTDRVGFVIAQADDREKAVDVCEQAIELIAVKGSLYALGIYGSARSAEQIRQDAILMDSSADDLLYLCYYNAGVIGEESIPAVGTTFTQKDSVSIDTLPSVPRTLEAVIRLSHNDYNRQGVIVGNYDNGTNSQINLEIYNNGVVRLFYNNGKYRGNCLFYGADVRKSEPTHIAVTIDGRLATLYVDGVAAATDTMIIDLPEAVEGFKVGGDNREGNTQYFKGELFSLHMFDDVRTPEEIRADYLGVDANADGLIYSRSFEKEGVDANAVPEYRPIGQIYDDQTLEYIGTVTTPHTFEATVMLSSTFQGRGGVIVSNYVGDNSDQISLEIYDGGRVRLFYVNNGIRNNLLFTTDIRSDSPTHLALSVDGLLATLYINGVAIETAELAIALPETTGNYVVGGDYRYLNTQYFKGVIYSVSLFKDARTAEDIAKDAVYLGGSSDSLLCKDFFAKEICDPYSKGFTHIESEWIVDCEPTELQNGLKHKSCTVCGEILVQREISNTRSEGAYVDYNVTRGFAPKAESDAVNLGMLSSTPLTFEALIQLNPNFDDRAGVILGSYNGTNANGLNLEIYTNGNPRLYYKVGGISYSYLFAVDVRSEALTHIAITIDGLKASLYVNGELAEEIALTVAAPATFDFNIGNDKRTNSGQYFKGTIFSVALFDDVRSAQQIKADAVMVTETETGVIYLNYFKRED